MGVGAGATHLLDEVHEAAAEAPGLVPVALQGVHGHLRCPLVAHRHDVDGIVQQGRVRLGGGPGLPESGSGPESPQPTLPCLPLSPSPKAWCPGGGNALTWLLMRGRALGVLQLCRHLTPSLCSSDLLCQALHPRRLSVAWFTFPASPASCPPQLKVLHVQDIIPTLCNHLFLCLHSHTWVGGGGAASDS